MKTINSKSEFEALLQADRAIVFLFFAWSGQAVESRKVVEEWENQPILRPGKINVSIYQLTPDEQPYTQEWIRDCVREMGGAGSVVWLRKGSMVGYVGYAARTGIETLAQLTHEYLVLG